MNKAELIDELSTRFGGNKRAAGHALESVLDTITRAVVKGEKVAITGFGVFERAQRQARTARNPSTGEAVKVKATTVPRFRPGQAFKGVVSGATKLPKLVIQAPQAAAAAVSAKKAAPKKAAPKKAAPKKAAARKTVTKRVTPARATTAKKSSTRKAAAKKTTRR